MGEHRITPIRVPGGSGLTPTGTMQFQDDSPGLFIRGDDAIALLGELRRVEHQLGGLPWRLGEVAKIIERDVIARPSAPSTAPDYSGT